MIKFFCSVMDKCCVLFSLPLVLLVPLVNFFLGDEGCEDCRLIPVLKDWWYELIHYEDLD